MIRAATLFHQPWGAMAFPVSETELSLTVRVGTGEVGRSWVVWGDRYDAPGRFPFRVELPRVATDGHSDYFRATISLDTRRFRYRFALLPAGESESAPSLTAGGGAADEFSAAAVLWFGERGLFADPDSAGFFQVPYLATADIPRFPGWATSAVFYQIFPDRFANGDPSNDPPDAAGWNERPTPRSRYGGDLAGIGAQLPYLEELGVTAIYLTPIFKSPSPHRYDTTDYFQVDPYLGDTEALRVLVQDCHARGIRVLLDAVYNHTGDEFWAFRDVARRGERSPFANWFNVPALPLRTEPTPNYETFATGIASMPKLMTHQPDVRHYLLGVARHWTCAAGIDGWRLDVANEVDHSFWREFRRVVKAAAADGFILGEAWHPAVPWVFGDEWDSATNYPVRDLCLEFFAAGALTPARFDQELARVRMLYAEPVAHLLVNLLGSHDTPRWRTLCGGDARKALLAATFLFTYVGIPLIYYGDEIGMEGGPDPDCRRPMDWEAAAQVTEIRSSYRRLIALRRQSPALQRGAFHSLLAEAEGPLYAYVRSAPGSGPAGESDAVLVVLNNGPRPVSVTFGRDERAVREALARSARLKGKRSAPSEECMLILPQSSVRAARPTADSWEEVFAQAVVRHRDPAGSWLMMEVAAYGAAVLRRRP